jgi:hypothetical protein
MSEQGENGAPEAQEELTRDRSPPFPFISLEKAIERAREFETQYKKSAGRIPNVLTIWGYSTKSSGGLQTVGALKAFGLMEDEGVGSERKIKLTELAMRILKDERPGKRQEAIQEAALKPKVIGEFWVRWREGRPPDIECVSELTLERGFTETAAKRFIQVYDDTIRFAHVETADKVSDKLLKELEGLPPKVKVGDLVQWAPGGVLQFPEPRRVAGLTEAGNFVLVEGSDTGLPIGEVTVMPEQDMKVEPKPGTLTMGGVAPEVKAAVPNVRQDVWNLDEGPVVLHYPAKMSAASFEDFEAWINLQLKKIKRGIEQ